MALDSVIVPLMAAGGSSGLPALAYTTQGSRSSAAAPFITKLFEILSQPDRDADSIRWGPEGDTIIVTDSAKFSREVLPRYFRHDNIRSFLRQLNIYGFQRCRPPTGSAARAENAGRADGELEFYHEKFMPGRKDLMCQIARGVPSAKRHVHSSGDKHACAADPPTNGLPASTAEASALSQELTAVRREISELDNHLHEHAIGLQRQLSLVMHTMGLDAASVLRPPSADSASASTTAAPASDPMGMPASMSVPSACAPTTGAAIAAAAPSLNGQNRHAPRWHLV